MSSPGNRLKRSWICEDRVYKISTKNLAKPDKKTRKRISKALDKMKVNPEMGNWKRKRGSGRGGARINGD